MEISAVAVAIISGIFGLIGGAVASLIAPWVHWGIEKRRDKMDRRRVLIDNTRYAVSGDAFSRQGFRQSSPYSAIRLYLSEGLRNDVESGAHSGEITLKRRIFEELAALEKKWKLI